MANFTQTITNSVRAFGNGPSTKWGQSFGSPYTMVFGVSTWGEGGSLPIDVKKVITNSVSPSFDFARASFVKIFEIGSYSVSHDMESEGLKDGTGVWNYVFTSKTTEGESRSFASWTVGAEPSTSFTCQSVGTTSWSEA